MTLGKYLASKGLTLCFIGMGAVLLFLFCAFQRMAAGLILFAQSSLLLLTVMWLLTDFLLKRKRIAKLRDTISQLKEPYLLGEVLPRPRDEAEEAYFEIVKTVSFGAVSAVERSMRERDGYESFVESWVHEIKTPLTACSLILENGGNAQKLRRELKRADNLTETVLYYARLKNPEKDTVIRPISVLAVVEDALRDQMPLLTAAGISAQVQGDCTVCTDEKALGFILKQFLCNTAKYCPKCKITVTAQGQELRYEDNGIGIPAHELSRVTERGFTGTNGRKLCGSTGMGLYLAKEMCDHMGIGLCVESEVGRFTRFTLRFPCLTKK